MLRHLRTYVSCETRSQCFDAMLRNLRKVVALSVRLHAKLSRAMVKARLGHLIGLLSLSQYTGTGALSAC